MKIQSLILLLLLTASSQAAIGQVKKSGTITYERKMYWVNVMSKLNFLSKEQIEREMVVWGKDQGKWGEKYLLDFTKTQTMYREKPSDSNQGFSWRGDEIMIHRDLANKIATDKLLVADNDFLVKGPYPAVKWKIHNEIRDILGYICMKATCVDPVSGHPVAAWFTDKIPVGGGPEGFGGLPGMILQLEYNTDDLVVEATNISVSDTDVAIALPKKLKGKPKTYDEYIAARSKYIKETVAGKRNPYWYTRY